MATRVRTFIVAVILGGVAAHVAWSTTMAVLLSSSYQRRMADARRWPTEVPSVRMITEMVSMFLSATMASDRANTVFFGSSVAYGFPWQEEVIVSTRYAALRPQERVLNAAVVGNNLSLLENAALCGAQNTGRQADVVIVELPVVNSILYRLRRERRGEMPPPEPCNERIGRVGYWPFVARHPIGAGWVSFIWDNKAFPKRDSTVTIGAQTLAAFANAKEFAPMEMQIQREVVAALERAKAAGKDVYAFVSPVLLPGAEALGFDPLAIKEQLASALIACRTVKGVHCLDVEPFYDRREIYYNLTHLNQHGHQVLAEWLADQIPEKPDRPIGQ